MTLFVSFSPYYMPNMSFALLGAGAHSAFSGIWHFLMIALTRRSEIKFGVVAQCETLTLFEIQIVDICPPKIWHPLEFCIVLDM